MFFCRHCKSSAVFRPRVALHIIRAVPRKEVYELQRSAAQLGRHLLPASVMLNILLWLCLKKKTTTKKRKRMFVGRPEWVHTTVTAGPLQRVLLGWSRNKVAYARTSVQSQPRKREKAQTGRTVSSAIDDGEKKGVVVNMGRQKSWTSWDN